MAPLAPLAAAIAVMKIGKAVSNAMSPTGGSPTPPVSIPNNKKPKAENYKDKNTTTPPPTKAAPQPEANGGVKGSTTQVNVDANGNTSMGAPQPTQHNGSTFNQSDYKKYG